MHTRGGAPVKRNRPPDCDRCPKHAVGLDEWSGEMEWNLNQVQWARETGLPVHRALHLLVGRAEQDAREMKQAREIARAVAEAVHGS